MHSNYSQTWRQINPAEFFLADFNHEEKQEEKEISFKKLSFEIIISFALFIVFAYSLSLVDKKIVQNQEQNQVFDFSPRIQIQEDEKIYEYFEQGYVGQNLIERNNYKYKIENIFENLKTFENLT